MMCSSDVHSYSMALTAGGITLCSSDAHSLNAYLSISSSPLPRWTVVNPEHFSNALSLIA